MITRLDLRNEIELSMVFITESTHFAKDDLAVFPPINHEDLYIDGFDRDRESLSDSSPSSSSRLSDSSSSPSLSPSRSDGQFEFDRKLQTNISQGWSKLLLARVLLKFQKMVTWFSKTSLCSFSRTLRSFYPVMVFVIWWWMRNRTRRRRHGGEIEAHLRDTVKERDERIAQLLHQIAQMNELIVKRKYSN